MGSTYATGAQKKDYTWMSNGFMTLSTFAEHRDRCVLTFEGTPMREMSLVDNLNNCNEQEQNK